MRIAIQIACVVLVLGGWQIATTTGAIDPLILPPLSAILPALGHALIGGKLWADVAVTLTELAIAFALAAVAGSLIGYAISRSAYAIAVLDPLLAALYAVPTILLYPLFLLFFGIGSPSKIALGGAIAFFPIVLSTIAAFSQVNRIHVAAARSMGAANLQLFWSVLVPAALPMMVAGLRLGLILGYLTILGAETLAANAGLGHQIVTLAESLEPPSMFADIFVAVAIAMLLNLATTSLESRGRRGVE